MMTELKQVDELKAVWVKKDAHKQLKKYCTENGKKMNFVIEKLIKDNCGKQQD